MKMWVLWVWPVCSILAGVVLGFVAYTTGKFPIWGCVLWGVFSFIGCFILQAATWTVVSALYWVDKHREEDSEEKSRSSKGGV